MPKGTLGYKIGMTQLFTDNGHVVPVTVILAGPVRVVQKKTPETDGYAAVQLGIGEKLKNVNKPLRGHFAKAQVVPAKALREFRIDDSEFMQALEVGDELRVEEVFTEGEYVDVVGITKGKGFAGVIKRHNFRRGPMGHGSHFHRSVDPWELLTRLSSSKGGKCRAVWVASGTVQGLQIVKIDAERNLHWSGFVPGPNGAY